MTTLASFEGADVVQSTIRITRAGDGLSDGLNVDPAEYHLGETVYVVLECHVADIAYVPIKDTDVLKRVHKFATELGTVVDGDLVASVLSDQRIKIERAKGIERLPLDGEPDDDE